MTPVDFPEANASLGAPQGMSENQVQTVCCLVQQILGGSCDGLPQVVVAWQPSLEEVELIRQGKPIYLSVIGGLPPHYLTMNLYAATHPA